MNKLRAANLTCNHQISSGSDDKQFSLPLAVDSRVRAGEGGAGVGTHHRAGSDSHVRDGPGPRAHNPGLAASPSDLCVLCLILKPHWGTDCCPVPVQSLQTDAYDHYSAIYSLLADRLKKHKNLPAVPPTPRPISYPLNAVQVTPGPCDEGFRAKCLFAALIGQSMLSVILIRD